MPIASWALQDKVAVITGGASGIGLGIARHLARTGCHIVIADIQHDKAAEAASEISALGVRSAAFRCDVGSRQSVEELAQSSW
jgi:NAD(P)-dependent dehydrogenase (short-subunit alcohol dehydrogenase family)